MIRVYREKGSEIENPFIQDDVEVHSGVLNVK